MRARAQDSHTTTGGLFLFPQVTACYAQTIMISRKHFPSSNARGRHEHSPSVEAMSAALAAAATPSVYARVVQARAGPAGVSRPAGVSHCPPASLTARRPARFLPHDRASAACCRPPLRVACSWVQGSREARLPT